VMNMAPAASTNQPPATPQGEGQLY
jgi:hypothetical protein